MSRFFSYLHSAKEILSAYKGDEPFAGFIKRYFSLQKKFGSTDRKTISHLCYCYFRMGKLVLSPSVGEIESTSFGIQDKILIGLFLCSHSSNEILATLKPEWDDKVSLSLEQKCSMFNYPYSSLNIFPWKEELSEGMEHEKFCESFFLQPDLFIRIRPHYEETARLKLDKAGVQYEFIPPFTIRLPNTFKVEQIFDINSEVVIQDYSSQQVSGFFERVRRRLQAPVSVWDCCAASGGKSIMAYDVNPNIQLTVSDIRESILVNLRKRFAEAGIKKYKSFQLDLSSHSPLTIDDSPFDLIICDAPCSGSGTWSRTPEQLYFFNKQTIKEYSDLQKKIISNIIPHLKPGGYLLYITCSVFKQENEEIVEFIRRAFGFVLVRMELLKGYDKKADTMYAAMLNQPL